MFVALLKLSWFIRGSFFLLLGKGRISLCSRRERRRKSDFFSVFPLQFEGESLFIYSPLGFDAIILFLFMRGRVFLVVAPRVFYLGGFSVLGKKLDFSVFLLLFVRRSVS